MNYFFTEKIHKNKFSIYNIKLMYVNYKIYINFDYFFL